MNTRPDALSLAQIAALRAARQRLLRRAPGGSWWARGRVIPGNSVTSLARRGWIEAGTDRPTSTAAGDHILDQITGRTRARETSFEGTSK